MAKKYLDDAGVLYFWGKLKAYFQPKLVSGTNIKTINNTSLLGSGNISISSGASVLDFYPVGSYYETSDTSFNPNTTWGGTWELETEGQVHIGAGSTYTVSGATSNTTDGGEATHTLTTSEMPSHTHTQNSHSHHVSATFVRYINQTAIVASGSKYKFFSQDNNLYTDGATATNQNTGGGGAHNNMPPYIIVNRWHRTA